MKCPVDKVDMMVVEHRRIELDYCLKCSGVWLDKGELELLVAVLLSEGAEIPPMDLDNDLPGARRKCPICRSKMDKGWAGRKHDAQIDICPYGHGLWFDAGELRRVLRDLQPPEGPESADVVTFLGEAFHATHKQGI